MKHFLTLTFPLALLLFAPFNQALSQCSTTTCNFPVPQVDARNACILPAPSALYGYQGATTTDFPLSFPPYWCITIENSHFFAFTADDTTAAFNIAVTNCHNNGPQGIGPDSLQAAVLLTADCINFDFVSACLGVIALGSSADLVAHNLLPGNVYYLSIDGYAGALCDYTINPVSTSAVYSESLSGSGIKILPNPFKDYVSISSNVDLKNAQLILYTMLGQEVKRVENIAGRNVTVNLPGFEKGIYLAVLQQSGKVLKQTRVVAE